MRRSDIDDDDDDDDDELVFCIYGSWTSLGVNSDHLLK
jgi:hypothetical protein